MRIRILNLKLIFLQCGGVTKQHYRQMVQLDESNIEIQVQSCIYVVLFDIGTVFYCAKLFSVVELIKIASTGIQ
jgi:hypothetical protein